jgi:2-polyprenyl-3-methyl-5-hydroxy-6-metoxy-1,4-benzoquinol methylase
MDDRDTIDLGCGRAKHPGAIGVDNDPLAEPDVVHDLDSHPYPFPSDRFRTVICRDVIEHVEDIGAFLREVHRIAAHGAIVRVRTPHFSSWYAYNDPTHRHVLGYFALDRYSATSGQFGRAPLFRYRKREIVFPRLFRLTGVSYLANAFPARYEQLFAFIFPAENLCFELEVVKPSGKA